MRGLHARLSLMHVLLRRCSLCSRLGSLGYTSRWGWLGLGDGVGIAWFPGRQRCGRSVEVVFHDLKECTGGTCLHFDGGLNVGELLAGGWINILKTVEDFNTAMEIVHTAFTDSGVVGHGVG